ncbi:uroporphyrinogen III decarboxylase [Plasmodium gonderi]|uniref:uroporphyrinogen decarboxylase n=1 Tax=Plasmodium gonderi TaxID=77519 RepID=A0A1Y1JJV4_PLAGO|nr:uroporphyrinogen III decarboxylase [Plasmodium gonderi]GAW81948.1 uroporphyrinogen III decarboxylase [Plasmodium gonderi]
MKKESLFSFIPFLSRVFFLFIQNLMRNHNENVEVYIRPENNKYEAFERPKNDLLLKVIENKDGEKAGVDKIPFWLMRQAGRYLPEYRQMRKKYEFFEICQNPELSSEVTIMPLKRFGCDMVVIFSDILIIFVAMGIQVKFIEKVGPTFDKNITTFEDFNKLNLSIEEIINNLHYVYDSINLTKKKINNSVPLLGFVGSPFTLFTYVTKNNKKTYEDSLKIMYENPKDAHKIINKLSDICISHLINQIDSGANVIQIFDSNADIVDVHTFSEFSLQYLKKVTNTIKKYKPQTYIILFLKDNFHPDVKYLNVDVFSITHKQLANYSSQFYDNLFDNKIILQGALDPHILLLNNERLVSKYTSRMINQISQKNKFIANLGHGILPNSRIENVHAFIDAVRKYKLD